MPPSAWTSLPVFGAKAPGKAPFSWPNSSLSMMFAAIALQSSDSSGPLARRLAAWIARATVSLPVPGFADDQDRQAVARRLGGDRERGAEFGRGADQLLERERRRELLGNGRKLAGGAAAVGIGGKRLEQPLGRDRADEEIGSAGAHRLDRERDAVAVRKGR